MLTKRTFAPTWAKKRMEGQTKKQKRHDKFIQNKKKGWYSLLEYIRTNHPKIYLKVLDNAYAFEQRHNIHLNEYSTTDTPYNWQKTE